MEDTTIENIASHFNAIVAATQELYSLDRRTAAPAPLSHRYIGTVIDNTIALLLSPRNSLAPELVGVELETAFYGDFMAWRSLMQAVHRSFVSSIHTATEKALHEILRANNIREVQSQRKAKYDALLEIIEKNLTQSTEALNALNELKNTNRKGHPEFNDHLESALKICSISKREKSKWRKYFICLSILRNKVSHSDPSLNTYEVDRLTDAGFQEFLENRNGTPVLVFSARRYYKICFDLLEFFDLLHNNTQNSATSRHATNI